jgi:hypothetical protein
MSAKGLSRRIFDLVRPSFFRGLSESLSQRQIGSVRNFLGWIRLYLVYFLSSKCKWPQRAQSCDPIMSAKPPSAAAGYRSSHWFVGKPLPTHTPSLLVAPGRSCRERIPEDRRSQCGAPAWWRLTISSDSPKANNYLQPITSNVRSCRDPRSKWKSPLLPTNHHQTIRAILSQMLLSTRSADLLKTFSTCDVSHPEGS